MCTITDFSSVGCEGSYEGCGVSGCTYYLETKYADCDEFCRDNGLTCETAKKGARR